MNHKPESEGFFYQPQVIRRGLQLLYGACVVLLLAEVVVHRHTLADIEKVPGFYALVSGLATVSLIFIAAKLRRFFMRDEDYYSQHEENIHCVNQRSQDSSHD